jgi:hypothetical protein
MHQGWRTRRKLLIGRGLWLRNLIPVDFGAHARKIEPTTASPGLLTVCGRRLIARFDSGQLPSAEACGADRDPMVALRKVFSLC